jgi:hypothetical protein
MSSKVPMMSMAGSPLAVASSEKSYLRISIVMTSVVLVEEDLDVAAVGEVLVVLLAADRELVDLRRRRWSGRRVRRRPSPTSPTCGVLPPSIGVSVPCRRSCRGPRARPRMVAVVRFFIASFRESLGRRGGSGGLASLSQGSGYPGQVAATTSWQAEV